MKTFTKNQLKIIGLLIFIVILLFVFYYKNKENNLNNNSINLEYKEKFNEGEDNKCNTTSLIKAEYGDENNAYRLPFKMTNKNYVFLIEDIQPFEPYGFLNRRDERNDTDSILEIKQTRNYIWCLNEGRNRLVLSTIDKLNKKKFRDVFLSEFDKDEDEEDSFYISAYGVYKSYCDTEEWCAVFLRNINNDGPNRLIFFRPSAIKENPIDMYNKQSTNNRKDIIIMDYVKGNKINLDGNIIIKKISDTQYNLYSINYNEQNKIVGEVKILKVLIQSLIIEDTGSRTVNIDFDGKKEMIKNLFLVDSEIKEIIEIIQQIKLKLFEYYPKIDIPKIKNCELYEKIKELKDKAVNFRKLNLEQFSNHEVYKFIMDIEDIEGNWTKNLGDVNETKFNMKMIKFLNKITNIVLTKKIKLGFCDIFEKYEKKSYKLYLSFYDFDFDFDSDSKKYNFLFNKLITEEKNKEYNIDLLNFEEYSDKSISTDNLNNFHEQGNKMHENIKKYRNEEIESIYLNEKQIRFLRTEMLDDDKKPDVNTSYQFLNGSIDIYNNVVGILEYKNNKEYDNLIQKANLFHKRNVIFTVYRNVENIKTKEQLLAIHNNLSILNISSMLVPGIKYTYEDGAKISLLKFFEQNVKPSDEEKFKSYFDWIYLFNNLRNEGLYDFSDIGKYNNQITKIQNSFKNNPDLSGNNSSRFTNRHKKLLEKELKTVFDSDSSGYSSYLDFFINDKMKNIDNFEVNILYDPIDTSVDTEDNTEEQCKEKKYLGIKKIANKVFKDIKNYSEFQLDSVLASEYEKYDIEIEEDRLKIEDYKFYKKKINSFNDFADIVYYDYSLGEQRDEKLFDRQRLRGLLELDQKFVDFEYIAKLKEIREVSPSYQHKLLDQVISQKEKIARKYTIKEEIFDINGDNIKNNQGDNLEKLINKLGYPFYVLYQERDYFGNPCSSEEKEKQKIFLTNVITKTLIKEDLINSNDKLIEFPFIKQEFLSFTGYGNMIQFYEKKFGGSTEIETPNLCSQEDVSIIDDCDVPIGQDGDTSTENCKKKKLTQVYLDGTAKCEINDSTVNRKGETGSEVLLLKSIDVNSCNIYMMKGNRKQYFKLGKIFGMNGNIKYQEEKQFTIQLENDDYLVYRDKIIKKVNENPSASGKINDEFIFMLTIDSDIYGIYFLFSPKLSQDEFLTRKVNPFSNKIVKKSEEEEFTLDKRLFDKDNINSIRNERNILTKNEYKDDVEYYSQKFIVPMALATNIAAEDGISSEAIESQLDKKRKEQQTQAEFFPALVQGTPDNLEISLEEEAQLIERNLAHLNKYLNDLNKLPPQQVESIPDLLEQFTFIKKESVKARKLMIEKLENIKFVARAADTAKNQESIYNISGPLKISNINNNTNSTNMDSKFSEFQLQESANSINKIRKQFKSKDKYQPKCYELEGFANMPSHYKDRTSQNNNNLVDKYYDYINSELSEKEDNLQKSAKDIEEILNNIKTISDIANNNTNKKKLKLSEELNKKNNVDQDVFNIKEYTQHEKLKKINKKINEIKEIKDELDKKEEKCKIPDDRKPYNYHSIISREDASLLNVYRLKENERNRENEGELAKTLDKNIIFVNGGCLSYDDKSAELNSKHCMIGDESQTFNIHRLDDEDDLIRYKLKNPEEEKYKIDKNTGKKVLERPFYIVSRLNEGEIITDDESCKGPLDKNKCLHNENGNLSFRNCDNIINQKWEYSNISGPCK